MKKENVGYVFGVLAPLSYAITAFFMKLASAIPSATIVFTRNVFCLICLIPFFVGSKRLSLKTNRFSLHLFRCLFGLSGMYCFVFATKYLSLVDAVLLINTSSLFIPIIVLVWLKVKIPFLRVIALMIGFIGVILIIKPSFSFFHLSGLIGLSSGIFVGTAFVIVNQLSSTEPVERIMFYFFFGSIIISIIPLIGTWKPIDQPIHWIYLLLIGVCAFCYQSFVTRAYSYAPATKVSILNYFGVVFGGGLDFFFFNKLPDIFSFLGMILVVSMGIFVVLHAQRQKIMKKA